MTDLTESLRKDHATYLSYLPRDLTNLIDGLLRPVDSGRVLRLIGQKTAAIKLVGCDAENRVYYRQGGQTYRAVLPNFCSIEEVESDILAIWPTQHGLLTYRNTGCLEFGGTSWEITVTRRDRLVLQGAQRELEPIERTRQVVTHVETVQMSDGTSFACFGETMEYGFSRFFVEPRQIKVTWSGEVFIYRYSLVYQSHVLSLNQKLKKACDAGIHIAGLGVTPTHLYIYHANWKYIAPYSRTTQTWEEERQWAEGWLIDPVTAQVYLRQDSTFVRSDGSILVDHLVDPNHPVISRSGYLIHNPITGLNVYG